MFYDVNPLAVSCHVPNDSGRIHIFSLHNRVINLINSKNDLITIHRYDSGLSPMGWSLKSADFDELYSNINQYEIEQDQHGNLCFDHIRLIKSHRLLSLSFNSFYQSQSHLEFNFFSKSLSGYGNETGLFGPLNQVIQSDLPQELLQFIQHFISFFDNQKMDLSSYIGLGPGLTPSYDDMIIGIMAIMYYDKSINKNNLSILSSFYAKNKLEELTTKVSAEFLYYAQKGIFTTNILRVLSLIRQQKTNLSAISHLLKYGHSSGADILLGMWLGLFILEQFK